MRASLTRHDFGDVFRLLRAVKFTQRHLASLIGMAQSEIADVATGPRTIRSFDLIARIAHGLGIPGPYVGLARTGSGCWITPTSDFAERVQLADRVWSGHAETDQTIVGTLHTFEPMTAQTEHGHAPATVACWTGAHSRALRQAMRLSQTAFADHLGVPATTVSAWETTHANAPLDEHDQAALRYCLARTSLETQHQFVHQLSDWSNPPPSTADAPDRAPTRFAIRLPLTCDSVEAAERALAALARTISHPGVDTTAATLIIL